MPRPRSSRRPLPSQMTSSKWRQTRFLLPSRTRRLAVDSDTLGARSTGPWASITLTRDQKCYPFASEEFKGTEAVLAGVRGEEVLKP